MIVRHFLSWVRNASAGERADATRALARAFLISDLSEDDRIAAEGALLAMLDDRAPSVRQAMSDVFAGSPDAPPAIVRSLAIDLPAIALPVIEHSPLLFDADLVDLVAMGTPEAQAAIARRAELSTVIAAAVAEVGEAASCLELLENPQADIAQFSIDRIVVRFGDLAVIREALLRRDDLAPQTRLALANKLSETLSQFAAANNWFSVGRATEFSTDVRERNIVEVAAATGEARLPELVRYLRDTAELTPGLVLRALLCGNEAFFESALVELSDLAPQRVAALVWDRGGAGLTALLARCGFPRSTFAAFRAAVDALLEPDFAASDNNATQLRLHVVARALAACEAQPSQAMQPILVLLRRFETEAARTEARAFCEEVVAEDAAAALQMAEQSSAQVSEYVAPQDVLTDDGLGEQPDLFDADDDLSDDVAVIEAVEEGADEVVLDEMLSKAFALLDEESGLRDDGATDYQLSPEMNAALEAALLGSTPGERSENPVCEVELRAAVDLDIAEYSSDDLALSGNDPANDLDDDAALKELAADYFGLGDVVPADHRAAA